MSFVLLVLTNLLVTTYTGINMRPAMHSACAPLIESIGNVLQIDIVHTSNKAYISYQLNDFYHPYNLYQSYGQSYTSHQLNNSYKSDIS